MDKPPKVPDLYRALYRCEECRTLYVEITSLKKVRCACGEDHWLCLACRGIVDLLIWTKTATGNVNGVPDPECPQAKRTARILMGEL